MIGEAWLDGGGGRIGSRVLLAKAGMLNRGNQG